MLYMMRGLRPVPSSRIRQLPYPAGKSSEARSRQKTSADACASVPIEACSRFSRLVVLAEAQVEDEGFQQQTKEETRECNRWVQDSHCQ
jgi:hypothetical protein